MSAIRARKKYLVDLKSLMSLFEGNYMRLLKLLPFLEDEEEHVFLLPALKSGQPERQVCICVTERCPYTTMLRVEQKPDLHESLPNPVLTVKMCHDARVAEVIAVHPHQRVQASYDYPNKQMHQRNEKLQWNRFLAEWLSHCNKHGLSSEPVL